jgi:predicted GIY-YIG superfamily endonuclease
MSSNGQFICDQHLYHRSEPWSGAYMIFHRVTGLFYIGSATNLHKRRLEHESRLRSGIHHLARLQEAYNQSQIADFIYWYSADRAQALQWEQSLLDQYWGNPLLLNFGRVADKPRLGAKNNERQREAARQTRLTEVVSTERREILSQSRLAFEASPEGRALRDRLSAQKRMRVSIDGVIYQSTREAAEKLGITYDMAAYRIQRSQNYRSTWFYCDEHGGRLE